MSATAKRAAAVVYPETDDMGEHKLQRFIAELLRPLVERWLRLASRDRVPSGFLGCFLRVVDEHAHPRLRAELARRG